MWPERRFQEAEAEYHNRLTHLNLSADEIKNMPLEQYTMIREKLMGAGRKPWGEMYPSTPCLLCERLIPEGCEQDHECTATPCMWCGELFHPDLVEAHEQECG